MDNLLRRLLHYFNLDTEVDDYDKIHEAIERDIIFRGTNLWILIFAIIVASVGLNMNSTAVVIGAMLISPLMGPINGMGYGVATYDFKLFRKAAKNFSFAVVAGLCASTLYFAISPISTAHSELLARTSPTIYDVLIALFGGLAGIVAIASRQKGNVIPGVAIATALMPPLCTAGYGLATGQFHFFFGALYLFAINSVFIGISALLVTQILKFPIRTLVDDAEKLRVNRWITAIIIVTIVPSIYFGYKLVQREQFVENAGRYVDNVSVYNGKYLLDRKIDPNKKNIELVYGGSPFSEEEKQFISSKTVDFKLRNVNVNIRQGLTIIDSLKEDKTETQNLTAEIQKIAVQLQDLEHRQDSLLDRSNLGLQLLREIKPRYPDINSCSYSESMMFRDSARTALKTSIIVFGTEKDLKGAERDEIRKWLTARLPSDSVRVYFEE